MRARVRWTASIAALAGALSLASAETARADYAPLDQPGPALSVPASTLRAALHCRPGVARATRDPILLIPGTNLDPEPNFSWNYQRAFDRMRWPYCTVTLPEHALGDIQVAGEHVVYALRAMARSARRKVDVLGFSQGGMLTRWALRFWPDTRSLVEDVVGLDPSNHGTLDADAACSAPCPAADWQQASRSRFMAALNSRTETFAGIDYTVIYSRTDEIVVPNLDASGSSSLRTGKGRIANVAVQEICPGDASEHLAMGSYDAVGYALAVDALTRPGVASKARVPTSVCSQPFQPGVNPATFAGDYAGYLAAVGAAQSSARNLSAEPPLRCYVFAGCPRGFAQATCADVRGRASGGRLGPVELGRARPRVRAALGSTTTRKTRRGLDRYCVSGGGLLEVGYPTARIPRRARHKLHGRAILALTSSRRLSVGGVTAGASVRGLRARVRGERRFRVGANTWYLAGARSATLVFKVRGRRVRAVGLAPRSLTRGRRSSRAYLGAWHL